MIRAVPLPIPILVRSRQPLRPTITQAEGLWLGIAVALTSLALVCLTYVGLVLSPPGVETALADGVQDVPLDGSVALRLAGWDARLEGATLYESWVAADGRGRESEVPIDVRTVRRGSLPGQYELSVRPSAGMLRPDTKYRLVVHASALKAALPLPRASSVEREVRFSTPTSPRPLPAAGPTRLGWGAPLEIRWNLPLEDLRYEISPPVASRVSIDPADRRLSRLTIENAEEGATYQVTISDARGVNGIRLQQPASYTVVAPSRPRLLGADEPLRAEVGGPVTLRFDQPIADLRYEISPALPGSGKIASKDPTQVKLRFEGLAQAQTYTLTLHEAVAVGGAPLLDPVTLTVETAPPLSVAEFLPGTSWVPTTVHPTVVFSEPVRDRAAAEAAVTLDPPVNGHFQWLDDQQLQYVPKTPLGPDKRLTLRVAGGPEGPRSAAGGYLDEEATYAFRTAPNKTIDVNVTRQTMTLIEGGRVVRNLLVATGVPGADTPIGEFRVQYKMPTARFRGYNAPAGRSYDLSDVKWVLAFMGDYTIHGAYWRQAFGAPGSNGCVSLTDADAKIVYDWAPEGTLIRIHY